MSNRPDYVRRAVAQVAARRDENRREVLAYLTTHPCIERGVNDPVVLEFDHRDASRKLGNVGQMIVSKRWARVRAEIEKCDVRCVKCHRRKTAGERRWMKLEMSSRIRGTPNAGVL